MWVDENGALHTVWAPPEAILGEKSAAALRALTDEFAETTSNDLYDQYERIATDSMVDAPLGPADLSIDEDNDEDDLPYPPEFEGPLPRPGETLSSTILEFLETVPRLWRMEAFEAITEILDREKIEE